MPDTRNEKKLSEQVDRLMWDFEDYVKEGPAPSEDAKARFITPEARMAWDFLNSDKARGGWSDALLTIIGDITRGS